ncbi:MAG TPA: ArsI/CadI family heavy metal resistance metalloenzyme [Pyrinomonadaceae bacterium]|nr:ArsI/CadI family heavy metal resistance metalloenzyme [Pyrinomonadaceae bacterium]
MEKREGEAVRALKAHLALNVRSVEASTRFYRRMLGIEPAKERAGYAKFDVQNPPLNLTLNELPTVQPGAISHLGIQLGSTEDVLAVRERWAAAGLLTRDEMQTNCCYALQDKAWVTDPDGNEWEAFVVLEDNLAETSMCCAPGASADGAESVSACATPTVETAAASDVSCCAPTTAGESSCCAPTAISR